MTVKFTKRDAIAKLLARPQGATVEQLQKVTGWQPHSVRAALTRLRHEAYEVSRGVNTKGVTVYKIARDAAS
jgi:hypothetical protein